MHAYINPDQLNKNNNNNYSKVIEYTPFSKYNQSILAIYFIEFFENESF